MQSEVQLKGEVAVRNQLLHAMGEQQNLMDALTAVSIYIPSFSCLLLLLLSRVCFEGCREAPRRELLTQEWTPAVGADHCTAHKDPTGLLCILHIL